MLLNLPVPACAPCCSWAMWRVGGALGVAGLLKNGLMWVKLVESGELFDRTHEQQQGASHPQQWHVCMRHADEALEYYCMPPAYKRHCIDRCLTALRVCRAGHQHGGQGRAIRPVLPGRHRGHQPAARFLRHRAWPLHLRPPSALAVGLSNSWHTMSVGIARVLSVPQRLYGQTHVAIALQSSGAHR